jgi:Aspartyl protease
VRIPFERIAHLVTVPVSVGSVETRFVLDTGIGPTLLAASLTERVGCTLSGAVFSGRRMSGQEVEMALGTAPSLQLGDLERRRFELGVLDLSSFPPELAEIGGFLSLSFFDDRPFTVDYPANCVVLETTETIADRLREGIAVEVELERNGPSLDAFLPLIIPGGASISAEVDMGSDALILDERFAEIVGVDLEGSAVCRVEGTDETGGTFIRWFGTLPGSIHPTGAPELAQEDPEVMFQRIIHDGLVGDSFLRGQPVTYDLAARRIVFGRAA